MGVQVFARFNRLLIVFALIATDIWASEDRSAVVTMQNGDVHNGIVNLARFALRSEYGAISIAGDEVVTLSVLKDLSGHRVVTANGDQLIGVWLDNELPMARTLDTQLSLHADQIRDITFNRVEKIRLAGTHDIILLSNGSVFSGDIQANELEMIINQTPLLIGKKDIAYLDVARLYDEDMPRIQVTKRDGAVLLGELSDAALSVKASHDIEWNIPMSDISALAFGVDHNSLVRKHLFRQSYTSDEYIEDKMRDGHLGPLLRSLSGGKYIRGDAEGDGDERPPKEIDLGPFAIGVHEVTFLEYDQFCEATGRDKPDDQEWGRGFRPVVNVTWKDAQAYVEWLSQQTGQRYRLPTDAEWEYAARGGQKSRYWWGDELGVAMANCAGCGSLWDSEQSAPVARLPANPFGLHDTAGNVFEWVEDCWNDSYEQAPSDGSALETMGCGKRVIRGGAWSFPPHEVRSANRWRDFPSRSSDDTGFRVVRELN